MSMIDLYQKILEIETEIVRGVARGDKYSPEKTCRSQLKHKSVR